MNKDYGNVQGTGKQTNYGDGCIGKSVCEVEEEEAKAISRDKGVAENVLEIVTPEGDEKINCQQLEDTQQVYGQNLPPRVVPQVDQPPSKEHSVHQNHHNEVF